MLFKLLVIAAVLTLAWIAIRNRLRGVLGGDAAGGARPPLVPPDALRVVAYGLLAVMLTGSGLWLWLDWRHDREVIEVAVVNPYSGDIQRYQARRGDVDGRSFRTLDGRRIHIAEMERMMLPD